MIDTLRKERNSLISITRRLLLKTTPAVLGAGLAPRQLVAGIDSRPKPEVGPFDAMSTAEDVTKGLDLSGKMALVTGCNSGIGFETMRVLALRGAHVLGCARSQEKAEQACQKVRGKTTALVVELTDFDSIVAASDQIRDMQRPLDMLICNAGVMGMPTRELVHGLEKHFVVNHLGHFILVNRLLDAVKASEDGRVAVVSSELHRMAPEGGIKFDDLAWDSDYKPMVAYGHSKLANGLFARALSRRLKETRASANALHPGVIKTNLVRFLPDEMKNADWDDRDVHQGAATSCYVASYPALRGVSGWYFSDCNAIAPSGEMQDEVQAERLWEVSEEITQSHLI